MILKTVIIDDEADSRQLLMSYLSKYCPHVHVVSEADSAQTGFEQINLHQPDMVFLDISMPLENGFDLLQKFYQPNFEVVFVTAYDSFALQAIKCSAVDYLLKPLDIEYLQKAVAKVSSRKQEKSILQNIQLLKDTLSSGRIAKIALPTQSGFNYVNIANIIRLEAEVNYTWFYMQNAEKLLVSRTLKEYEQLLELNNFIRVHQSHLVNPDYIKAYNKEGFITMADNTYIEVSTRKRAELVERLRQ